MAPKRRFHGNAVPDHLRCRRSDGRRWRCPMPALPSLSYCHHHRLQLRLNNLARKNPKRNSHSGSGSDPPDPPPPEGKRRRRRGPPSEELIEMALSWQMGRREEREKRRKEEEEVTRDLPNGVMAIAASPPARVLGNVGPPLDVKVGFDAGCFLRRCFRSKNVEPIVPVGSIQRFCNGRVLKRDGRRRRICDECCKREVGRMVRCTCCRKEFSCKNCRKECYKTCMQRGAKEVGRKVFSSGQNKFSKLRYAEILVCQLLPVLKKINQAQIAELEVEASNQGRRFSGIQVRVAEYNHSEQPNCNCCKISIADFHRSCSKCSYKLCLSCCREIRGGSLPVGVAIVAYNYLNKRESHKHVGRTINGKKRRFSSRVHSLMRPEWKVNNIDGNISCPPNAFGGCGVGILNLKLIFPFGGTRELDIREG